MALLLGSILLPAKWENRFPSPSTISAMERRRMKPSFSVKAFVNPLDDPILKQAFKEPVAFVGGVFAGLLRLDLNEEPLREWIAKTVEVAGIDAEGDAQGNAAEADDEGPQPIEIE
ncbi:UPF0426 protein At1g28150, chloroplastic-like [Zingiber officinale]|uniref:UPF0426 protein At1g28150, chloroplastic-like n=1 Tax=Zingiber officinale TaxID=94328 RepID=UPI001C4B4CFB|nr:UPF0426 protein At1g28150, chloroplastic-like [Zingiber officinale]